ncbi:MAG TPA: hypothetical protein VJS85_00405 [Rhizomicrobium sp.]|nr:hypothetical protein [Rhizomicrobium sp.]
MGSLAHIAPRSCSRRKIPRAEFGVTLAVGVVLTFALLLSMLSPADAACLANDPRSPGGITSVSPRFFSVDKEFQNSTFVLTAKVMSVRDDFAPFPPAALYRVARLKSFKGAPPDTLTIRTERSSGGFYMDVGKTYLLFVVQEGSDYVIDNCGYSDLVSKSKDVFAWLERASQIQK